MPNKKQLTKLKEMKQKRHRELCETNIKFNSAEKKQLEEDIADIISVINTKH